MRVFRVERSSIAVLLIVLGAAFSPGSFLLGPVFAQSGVPIPLYPPPNASAGPDATPAPPLLTSPPASDERYPDRDAGADRSVLDRDARRRGSRLAARHVVDDAAQLRRDRLAVAAADELAGAARADTPPAAQRCGRAARSGSGRRSELDRPARRSRAGLRLWRRRGAGHGAASDQCQRGFRSRHGRAACRRGGSRRRLRRGE